MNGSRVESSRVDHVVRFQSRFEPKNNGISIMFHNSTLSSAACIIASLKMNPLLWPLIGNSIFMHEMHLHNAIPAIAYRCRRQAERRMKFNFRKLKNSSCVFRWSQPASDYPTLIRFICWFAWSVVYGELCPCECVCV